MIIESHRGNTREIPRSPLSDLGGSGANEPIDAAQVLRGAHDRNQIMGNLMSVELGVPLCRR